MTGAILFPGPGYKRYLDFYENQVRFWQDQGRLGKSVAATDLLDLSFIGEEVITPQSWRQ
jgi:hypothetical protein